MNDKEMAFQIEKYRAEIQRIDFEWSKVVRKLESENAELKKENNGLVKCFHENLDEIAGMKNTIHELKARWEKMLATADNELERYEYRLKAVDDKIVSEGNIIKIARYFESFPDHYSMWYRKRGIKGKDSWIPLSCQIIGGVPSEIRKELTGIIVKVKKELESGGSDEKVK